MWKAAHNGNLDSTKGLNVSVHEMLPTVLDSEAFCDMFSGTPASLGEEASLVLLSILPSPSV